MNFKSLKWIKLVGYISGGGLAGVFGLLQLVAPKYAPIAAAASGALIAITGAIGVLNPTPNSGVVTNSQGNVDVLSPTTGKPTATLLTTTSTEHSVVPITPDQIKENPNGPNWKQAFGPNAPHPQSTKGIQP